MLNFPFQESSLKSLCSCHGELCFLVNNDSFHSSTAFSPVSERDRAEGKERESGRVVLRLLSLHSSNIKSTAVPHRLYC